MVTVRNYIEAAKRRKKEETGEEGFSLIELIIVVVILGILVAIALPIFANIQATAVDGATQAATKNAATTATADIAQGKTLAQAQTDADSIAGKTSGTLTITISGTTPAGVCAAGVDTKGSKYVTTAYQSGPGC